MPAYPHLLAIPAAPESVDGVLWEILQAEELPAFTGALCFAGERPDRTLAVCDSEFTDLDDLARLLAERLGTPVLAIAMIDDANWRYALAVAGDIVDRFCTDADFHESWPENAATLAARWPEVSAKDLAPYLVDRGSLAAAALAEPATPEDEYSRGDGWQFCDFLRPLALRYPEPGESPWDPDWEPAE